MNGASAQPFDLAALAPVIVSRMLSKPRQYWPVPALR